MDMTTLYVLGFVAQGCFGARSIVQWVQSERVGRVVSPTLFWVFSLVGASLFLIYGLLRQDPVIIVGQTLSFYIYLRNLQLKGAWQKVAAIVRYALLCLPLVMIAVAFSQFQSWQFVSTEALTEPFLLVGAIGQLSLNARYVYQWYHSERAGLSLLPLGFWIISAVGSLLVVVYGIFRNDPVLLVSQALGMVIYVRNIVLHTKTTGASTHG
jgi:lipid-A-disaccharide synthase-like uncharacterized protein